MIGSTTYGQAGVYGFGGSPGASGVLGENGAPNGAGVTGTASSGNGVIGTSSATGYAAIYGRNDSGYGVYGENNASTLYAAVAGTNRAGGYAGYFIGAGYFSDVVFKAGGGFKIDHPLDAAHKFLQHSFVESPDMKDVYDGIVTTDADGLAVVDLPAWFEALNRDFRYQLTVIGRFAQAIVEQEISGNRFTIRTNLGGVKVSWQVTGIRHDAWADAHRLDVEQVKVAPEDGKYLHPALFGQPEAAGIDLVHSPEARRRPDPERASATAAPAAGR